MRAEELINVAFESGAVDLLVCAYRSNPDLLTTLLDSVRRVSNEQSSL